MLCMAEFYMFIIYFSFPNTNRIFASTKILIVKVSKNLEASQKTNIPFPFSFWRKYPKGDRGWEVWRGLYGIS